MSVQTGSAGTSGTGAAGTSGTGAAGASGTGAAGASGTGAAGASGTGAAGASGTGAAGASGTGAAGASGTGAAGAGGSSDPNCTSALAKTGAQCTVNCIIPCGYGGLGTKTCTCAAGVYSMCPCPVPPGWMGAATAPRCATADGTTTSLKNTACTTQWAECVGTDPVSGTTPQGCACLLDAVSNSLMWKCGSTNKWFSLAM